MKKVCLFLFIIFCFIESTYAQNPSGDNTKETIIEENTPDIDNSKEGARKKLETIRQRVLDGESMATLATLYSEDPGTKKTAGVYFNVAHGQFVPEFEAAAFNLQPGGISEVFETQYGFHFVQLIARRGDVIDVRHILIRTK